MTPELFPFSTYWWFYAAFTAFVVGLLALDLGLLHRKAQQVGFREAAAWTGVWIALALSFNFGLYLYARAQWGEATAARIGLEFLAGYLVEESLSIDNIFVFVLLFRYFAIPAEFQHRVLFLGIAGAIVFRALFIAAGSVLMEYHWVVMLFGAFLVLTGAKMLFLGDHNPEPGKNPMLRLMGRFVPLTTRFSGQHLTLRENGVLYATPLAAALAAIETTDIIFALDSVPAVFGLTREPLIVFTSNIFAILGLRSMYFLLAGAIDKFHLLRYGVALVLVFVGLKMTVMPVPITWSLGVIVAILAGSILLSIVVRRDGGGFDILGPECSLRRCLRLHTRRTFSQSSPRAAKPATKPPTRAAA